MARASFHTCLRRYGAKVVCNRPHGDTDEETANNDDEVLDWSVIANQSVSRSSAHADAPATVNLKLDEVTIDSTPVDHVVILI